MLDLLNSGREFSELAREYSTHSTAQSGGYWGPISDQSLIDVLAARLEGVPSGGVIHFSHPKLGQTIIRKLDPKTVQTLRVQGTLKRGNKYLEQNKVGLAITEFKKAISLNSQHAEAHMLLGYAYRLTRSYEMIGEAKAELRQALALNPALVWARFYLARIYSDLGRDRRAKEELEKALETASDKPYFLALLGDVNRKLGDPKLSVQQNRRALDLDPSLSLGHYYLALAYLELDRKEEAVEEMEIALSSKQVLPEMFLSLGSIHLDDHRFDKAISLFQHAIELDPSRSESHLKLAKAYRGKGDSARAMAELNQLKAARKSFSYSPYFQELRVETFFEIGLILQDEGRMSDAAEAYREALKLKPDNGKVYRQLAEVLFRQGEYSGSLEHARKAAELGFPLDSTLLQQILQMQK
ncbi:tetratricopeptide repeat protein [Acidobacteria bacterium AH-259-O06]|nr:tetratricopeptide repeat protein [Acidobacteria bacterium AH-259-O06]